MDKAKIKSAVDAIRGKAPSEILETVAGLSGDEIAVVGIVLELTEAPRVGRPRKRKAADAGK